MTTEVDLGAADELELGKARAFEVAGRRVCVVRVEHGLRAIDDRCSHEDFPLSEGEVDLDECLIECWKHGSLFSLEDGHPLCLPATQPVAVYEAFEKDGRIVVRMP